MNDDKDFEIDWEALWCDYEHEFKVGVALIALLIVVSVFLFVLGA